jgi:nucleoside-diphosphate-sugar epimerase
MSAKLQFLVTGGAGFIGSHIVKRLLKEGHFVRVLDNFSSGKKENLDFILSRERSLFSLPLTEARETTAEIISTDNFELILGDIRNYDICLKACIGIDYVLHQAALCSVPESLKIPYQYNAVNIMGTLNLLKAAKQRRVKRFVFASSSSIYGNTDIFPQKENSYPLLISPYALTKLAGEYYCRIFSENFALETVALRYFNVYGPGQALDDEYAVVIPKFITCLLNGEQPPIFGDGSQSRDFIYIDNVVEANILAAIMPLRNSEGDDSSYGTLAKGKANIFWDVFNVANGEDNTLLQLVAILNSILEKDIKPKFLPSRPADVLRTLADITKIKAKLGFKPKINFTEGLKKTVQYFKQIHTIQV